MIGHTARLKVTGKSNRNRRTEEDRREEIHHKGELVEADQSIEEKLHGKEGVANVCKELRKIGAVPTEGRKSDEEHRNKPDYEEYALQIRRLAFSFLR